MMNVSKYSLIGNETNSKRSSFLTKKSVTLQRDEGALDVTDIV